MPIIQVPTPHLKTSQAFYEKLGFKQKDCPEGTLLTGGEQLQILINSERTSRVGLRFYNKDWKSLTARSNWSYPTSSTKEGYLVTSPGGCPVYLINDREPIGSDNTIPKRIALGNFNGLSIETNAIEESILFWNQFGFKQTAGNLEQGWVSLEDESGFAIGLMKYNCCPHLFLNPSLNFFNGKNNPEIIQNIRQLGISITEEITVFNENGEVDNIIVQDPGGLGFFIFND